MGRYGRCTTSGRSGEAVVEDSLGEAISVDAKSRRGSRRELPALSVVVAAGQEVKGEHVIEAALSKERGG